MQDRRKARWGLFRRIPSDEHGNAMAEYAPLLAVIALVVFFAVSWFGPWAYTQIIDASIPLYGDSGCPDGEWSLVNTIENPANGNDRDINNDGWYCIKTEANQDTDLPGNGNNDNNADIKDNDRPNP
jgi:Flp pilus assembly pilin Flp